MSEDSVPSADGPAPAVRKKPPALGRGLGALLGDVRREEPLVALAPAAAPAGDAARGLMSLSVASIEPHPEQPRRHFDEAALDELAASIAARGVIQPVVVRPLGEGRYQLVAGQFPLLLFLLQFSPIMLSFEMIVVPLALRHTQPLLLPNPPPPQLFPSSNYDLLTLTPHWKLMMILIVSPQLQPPRHSLYSLPGRRIAN